jgi:hypothetical protein
MVLSSDAQYPGVSDMSTSTSYHPADRNPWPKIVTVIAAVAAAVMLLAAIMAEVASHGVSLQLGAAEPAAACRAASDRTMPLRLQSEMQVHCGE